MNHIKTSNKIFLCLIIIYAITAFLGVFLPMGTFGPTAADYANFPVTKPILALITAVGVFVVYGLLGFIGFKLSRKLGFPEIWDPKINNKQRFIIPAIVGIFGGIYIIIVDFVFNNYNGIGHIPHPAFPASLNASLAAGIGEEIIFRLFFTFFWTWLISYVIFRKRWLNQIYWIISVIAAFAFAVSHFPAIMFLMGLKSMADIPIMMQLELILLNGVISIFAAYYYKKYGLLAAIGIHFWADVVWHVIFGAIIS
jgi:hypothetical protein